ncbi:MAG: hypothetical protein COT81_04795 [Candidatus Buchananbacteria bacterium CG10_big_fil_rev_8_21_14_0_10_42_9]|uniref:Uncharacterized protein n=1 Tax=Candidatus Buchananbacteria bacterium CG10_big_fil_rev_8_21_14_0_10_42_9 TaxID=1974526 RepID=A0A2H0W081_9BACT|nr:MAG: hypothetical protein COT81_04795 [Candidatus Buchananbacteria bacterium CG10_big_fil_rev_8_21_14_0_10_42_9]
MLQFLTNSLLLVEVPKIAFVVILVITSKHYFADSQPSLKKLFYGLIIFYIAYGATLTALQYWAWSGAGPTRWFLNQALGENVPLTFFWRLNPIKDSSFGYFAFYTWGRFWLNILITILASLAFQFLLAGLRQFNRRWLTASDVWLGSIGLLLSGYPGLIVFFILTFVFVLIYAFIRLILYKKVYTTIGIPMIIAALISILWGEELIFSLNLGVFNI